MTKVDGDENDDEASIKYREGMMEGDKSKKKNET